MFKRWIRQSERKSPHRMTGAELHSHKARLSIQRRIARDAFVLLPAIVVALAPQGMLALGMGAAALGLPVLPAVAVAVGLGSLLALSAWNAVGSIQEKVGRLHDKYAAQLGKIDAEQQRRAARSPALLAMMKETNVETASRKRNKLSTAAAKAFQGGTDKMLTIRGPLKLAAAPDRQS